MSYTALDPKDPDDIEPFAWDFTHICTELGVELLGVTIVEVDADHVPVAVPTVTISDITWTTAGIVTALIGGGMAGTVVFLRCRATFTRGQLDRTIRVRIVHQ